MFVTLITKTIVKATLRAFHTDPYRDEGRHQHTWLVRVHYDGAPFRESRDLRTPLVDLLAPWQGQDLPDGIFASEDLASLILQRLPGGPLGVQLVRPGDEASDAEVWRA